MSANPSQRDSVVKIRIAEARVMVERIINRMIRAAAVFAPETDIKRGNSEMLKKRCVIRTRTERGNPQIAAIHNFVSGIRRTAYDLPRPRAFPDSHFCLRIGDVTPNFVDKFFERVRTANAKKSAPV